MKWEQAPQAIVLGFYFGLVPGRRFAVLDDSAIDRQVQSTLQELRGVEVKDNGERLVDVLSGGPGITVNPSISPELRAFTGKTLFARRAVVRRLHRANKLIGELIPGASLRVWTAYRHPYHVTWQFVTDFSNVRARKRGLSYDEAEAFTDPMRSAPDVSPHATGGAVDVTIVVNGRQRNLIRPSGSDDWTDEKDRERFHPFSDSVSPHVQEMRLQLRRAMLSAGFSPTFAEWWHFAYGDREWALYYNQPAAIYDITHHVVQ